MTIFERVKTPLAAAVVLAAGATLLGAGPRDAGAEAAVARGSALAYPRLAGEQTPELVLAQRTIERSWGLDPGAVVTPIPGWRSEGLAFLMSGAVPGSGQVYAGERRGWWYAAVEVVGWAAHLLLDHEADSLRRDAEHQAGLPADPASPWSFDRWELATGGDAGELRALYQRDREVFWDAIGYDPAYLPGWAGDAGATRAAFIDLRKRSNTRRRFARVASTGLLFNHLVAAFDAVRIARGHNRAIAPGVGLRIERQWQDDGLALTAAVERRF